MTIKSFHFSHFQRHRDYTLELDPKITILTGPTDAGKSSLIRGIGFCLRNSPSSAKLMTKGQDKPAEVTAFFRKKWTIKRTRGKKTNTYHLDGKVYKAFGRDKTPLPPPVARFVNVSNANFQRQIDGPLWFTKTPGEVSKHLNTIVNLEEMDKALAAIASETRQAQANVKFCRDRLKESKARIGELVWVPGAVAQFAELQALKADFDSKASRRLAIEFSIREATSARKMENRALQAIVGGKNALSAGRSYLKARRRAKELGKLVGEAERAERIAKLKIPDIGPLLALRKECDEIAEYRRDLESLVEESLTARRKKCDLTKRLDLLRTAEKRLRPKTCPRCGQILLK